MRAGVRVWFFVAIMSLAGTAWLSTRVTAVSTGVVIRSVIAADVIDTNDELIELENQSQTPVDITNWSLVYISSTNSTSSLYTIRSSTPDGHVILPAGARETFFSTKYVLNHPLEGGYKGAEMFSGKMGYSMAGVELRDDTDTVVDVVRWGSWSSAIDASPAPAMSTTTFLQRIGVDTDNNERDFARLLQSGQAFVFGNLMEVVDQCTNLDGLQVEVPLDMVRSGASCVSADVCPNLDGVQLELPDEMELYRARCVPVFVPAALSLTELLPNPSGVDTGNEYVELYNSSDQVVMLEDYYLDMNGKRIAFPGQVSIEPGSYKAFNDNELGVVFANTTGVSLRLFSRNNILVDATAPYSGAPIDMSWAWVNDAWQYTNQTTPGEANRPSMIDDGMLPTPDSGVVACSDGYYRNPLTNRCNKIKADEIPVACQPDQYRSEETGRCRKYATQATPAACKEGQYRSEETGRCRSIALAATGLKPCDDDQFRNPATGRCKQIASIDDLPKPCAAGYERNPETSRCRKMPVSSMPLAAFPVEPVKPSANTVGIWLVAGGVIACGLGYAGWEWRRELVTATRRIAGHFGRK